MLLPGSIVGRPVGGPRPAWAWIPPRSAFALSEHCGLWAAWEPRRWPHLTSGRNSKLMQDKEMTGLKGGGIPLGWNLANGAELEVRFPDPMEPEKT